MRTFDIRNVHIKTRMYGLVFLFLIFLFILGGVGLTFIRGIRSNVEDLYHHPFKVKNAIVSIDVKIRHMQKILYDYIYEEDTDLRKDLFDQMDHLHQEIDGHFKVIEMNYLGDLEDYIHIRRGFELWNQTVKDLIENTDKYDQKAKQRILREKESLLIPLFGHMHEIAHFSEKKAEEFYLQSHHRMRSYQIFFSILVLVVIIFFLFAARIIIKSIIKPIISLNESAEEIRNGNLVIHKPKVIRDEIDQLADTFGEMTQKLIESNLELEKKISERTKDLEIEIDKNKESLNSLRKSEKLFRSVFDSDLFGAIFWKENGTITQTNDHYLHLIGYTKEEYDRNGLNWKTLTPLEDIGQEEEILQDIHSSGIKPFRKRYIHKDGHIIHALVGAAKVTDSPFLGIAFVIDISEQVESETKLTDYQNGLEDRIKERTKKLESNIAMVDESRKALTFLLEDVNDSRTELERVNQQLDSVNKELEAFSYSVSHDLKAPLRAIDGFSLALFEDYQSKLDGEAKDYIDLIRNNAKKMGQLIKDLLEFSRMGRKVVNTSIFSVEDLAKEVFDEINVSPEKRTINLIIDSNAEITADRSMIKQVMINLLSNAIKFTRKRDNGEIHIGCKILEKDIEVYVKDNGVGFDMKYLDKLFGVFQRLHSDEDFEGTGVGLALVKRIITKHQGTIRAEGEVDKGASFFMTFPLPKDDNKKDDTIQKEEMNG